MKDKLKKYLLPNLPYLFFVYLFDKLCQAVRLVPGLDASEKLLHIGQGFQTAFASSAPSFHALDICVGILGAILVRLAVYVKGKNAKKYRKGIEYGSARWGYGGGYCALHRPRSRLEHPPDQDGKPHHDQPSEGPENSEK